MFDSRGSTSLVTGASKGLGAPQTDFDTFALQVGGGVDLRLSPHFAIRPLQADWLRTQFPNGATNVQNDLRLGAEIVFRFLSKS
jgi:hypothetical protein